MEDFSPTAKDQSVQPDEVFGGARVQSKDIYIFVDFRISCRD